MDSVCVILVVLDLLVIVVASLPSWNMHYTCGQTISKADSGGFLILDSDSLPAGHKHDCRVVIQPASPGSASSSGSHVLFHFSDFEVGKYCRDTNVSVIDGNGINMEPIEGLRTPLCGANSSLTKDVTFTTQSYFMTVLFQRSATGLNFKSKFNLTFLSFTQGGCGSSDENLFSCSNDRCIDKSFVCQKLNPCGDSSDCPSKSTTLADNFSKVLQAMQYVAVVIVVIIFLGCFVKGFSRRGGSLPERVCDACERICDLCGRCCRGLGTIAKCKPCRDCCGEVVERIGSPRDRFRDCCGSLRTRIVAAFVRLKSRFTSTAEDEHSTNEEAQTEPTQGSSQNRSTGRALSSQNSIGSEVSRDFHNQAYDSDGDSYLSDFESYHSDRETRNSEDAPPSYHEAAASARPLPPVPVEPSAPPVSLDTAPPPSYDEVVANKTKYMKRKK